MPLEGTSWLTTRYHLLMDTNRFSTTASEAFGTVPNPDPPPPIGSRKELTQTNWKIGDARSESNGRHGSTFKTDFTAMHGEAGKQTRTKKQLTQTNWIGGDAKSQTWSCTNDLPKCGSTFAIPLSKESRILFAPSYNLPIM